ncbi:Flp family type IVb pilin [Burkholderia sp. WAC0059]|uniref:Flp family type IVb pilin n=1 Tax=Burkholderia sp. WAC0059 TaxID=2066022 RepID=UPI000C7ED6F6|nr:Flp family type IVb pilin [Burkholderia sp. WAC0059]PLZ03375.1 Flp family type IVb pilin [Burkholderia sp. WAC0059]
MRQIIRKLWADERGVTALEYAILAAVVVVAVTAAGAVLENNGTGLPGLFTSLMTKITTALNNTGG